MPYSHQFTINQLQQMHNIQDLKPSMSIMTLTKLIMVIYGLSLH